jgi:hypothetical protein
MALALFLVNRLLPGLKNRLRRAFRRATPLQLGLAAIVLCYCIANTFALIPYIAHKEIVTSSCRHCALVLTPYDVIPGGGENYLLRSVSLLQKIGYVVDLMVLDDNACTTLACVRSTASFLRVDLDYKKVQLG